MPTKRSCVCNNFIYTFFFNVTGRAGERLWGTDSYRASFASPGYKDLPDPLNMYSTSSMTAYYAVGCVGVRRWCVCRQIWMGCNEERRICVRVRERSGKVE